MYAVIKTGGHQYRVKEGDVIRVDLLSGQAGDKITFDKVLMVGGSQMKVGAPFVAGAKVAAVIQQQEFDPKIRVFKYKRRKNFKKEHGHKQPVSVIQIGSISG
jgi:large subunit ribosomal protein L21